MPFQPQRYLEFLVILVSLLCFQFAALTHPTAGAAQSNQPNIILINLDDADTEMFELSFSENFFPNIIDSIARQGLTFSNMHVTTPLCGPSRACLYRGQYAHNTGIRVNNTGTPDTHGFEGGFKYYREQGYFDDDLGIWMQNAGYRTMMVGKFLHEGFESYVPPGWDDYHCSLGARYYGAWQFTNRTNPDGQWSSLPADLYRTNAEAADAIELIEQHTIDQPDQPFFLNINPLGPHQPADAFPDMIERRHETWWTKATQIYSPAYDEQDFSDKRGVYRMFDPIDDYLKSRAETQYRHRLLATRSVDDMVGEIIATLKRLGTFDNTYIFITSDNGYSLGHHRMLGKGTPTERSTRVPLLVIGPNVPNKSANHLLGHIDLAPTFVELAGGTVPDFVDGKSFATLLLDPVSVPEANWRQHLLIENWQSLISQHEYVEWASTSMRTMDGVYTEWAGGDRDYFDLNNDPHQINNSYDFLSEADKTYLHFAIRTLKNPDQLPAAHFSFPHKYLLLPANTVMRGYAEDSFGVTGVRIAIRDQTTGEYWNGQSWQSGFKLNSAEIANRHGQITEWSYNLDMLPEQIPTGSCGSWVWAYDRTGRHDQPKFRAFKVEDN